MNKQESMAVAKTPNDLREERMLKSIRTLLANPSEETYSHVIAMWSKIIETADFKLKADHFDFVFTHLLPSALNQNARPETLKAIKDTVVLLQNADYRSHPKYKEFLEKSISDYMPTLKEQIEKMPDWSLIWCSYLTVVRKDMARSIQINAFLSVAESGFRSSNIEMRTKSFVCWRKLIEIFAAEGQLLHMKRVRLITVPLQTTASKNLDLATAKFNCWWYLVNHINPEASDDHAKCFIHFLSFCFGPLNDLPLQGYVKNSSAVSPGKLYNELRLTVVAALILILGPPNPLISNLKLERPIDDLKPQLNPNKVFPICRREIIYCCAEATVLVYTLPKMTGQEHAQLTMKIWDNLFAMIKQDDQLTKGLILAMEAITAIVNLCGESQRRGLSASIPVIYGAIKDAKLSLKGAQLLTEFCKIVVGGLTTAAAVVEKAVIEKYFKELIMDNYQTIILFDNKVNFVTAITKELMQDKKRSSFVMWQLVWSKLLRNMDRSQPMDFLKFGLENHFNEMIQEKDIWIFNWNIMAKNQYLNQVARLFQAAAKEEAASFHIVEVVTFMLMTTDHKFDKNNVPSAVLKLFSAQMARFVHTEFAMTFIDSLNLMLKQLPLEQFVLILEELNETMKVVYKCSKSTMASEGISELRKSLREKCALITTSTHESCKAFLLLHKEWISAQPCNASKKMGQPIAPPKKKADEDFVPIKRDWSFNPKELTEHQIERMKERRDDIPALYNDNSQSQDTRSLQPWALKTTPAAADIKEAKEQSSVFASVANKKPEPAETAKPTLLTNGNASSAHLKPMDEQTDDPNTSRSGTPTQKKKSRAQTELSRLTIDTVEGQTMFAKKTRLSRRVSSDTRNKDTPEYRTSPRKTPVAEQQPTNGRKSEKGTTPAEKLKSRRNTIVEVKKEKTETTSKPPKAETVSSPSATTKETTNTVESAPATENEIVADTQEKQKEIIPKAIAELVAESRPMVSIPYESPSSAIKEPTTAPAKAPVEPNLDTEIMTENMPTVENVPEPMDVGSESFIEEMNLAVSANTSANPQRSIVSSPEDLGNAEERETTFLNDTINISPIPKEAQKEQTPVVRLETVKPADPKAPEILTTPKRSIEPTVSKENNPTAVSTTPHSFFSKMNGRGAQMLQQTKLFQESTPKEKAKEVPVINKEDTLQRMLLKTTAPVRSSPSSSILRRKRLEDDMDDTYESPAAKKKKVSFSDPPVSATKEFERDSDRARPLNSTLDRMLMRKSRKDSASELRNLRIPENGTGGDSESEDDPEPISEGSRPGIVDDSKIFEYLQKKYSEVGDEDEAPPKLPLSQIRKLSNVLVHSIGSNPSAKEEFFQKLMLTMPKETLHWAVKENSSYAFLTEVKEQVSSGTFINYIINLLKTDEQFTQQMTREIGLRMDSGQTLKFIGSILRDTSDKA